MAWVVREWPTGYQRSAIWLVMASTTVGMLNRQLILRFAAVGMQWLRLLRM
jgi:hypothetical protein